VESDDAFWDAQIARLLRKHREPELAESRLAEIGRETAERLREDAVLDANLRSLLPRTEDPPIEPGRLEEIGARLAGSLEAPSRRLPVARLRAGLRRRPGSSAALAWGAAAAAVFLLVVLAAVYRGSDRAPAPRVSVERPREPEPEPLSQQPRVIVPAPVPKEPPREDPPKEAPPPARVPPAPPAPRPEPPPAPPAPPAPRATVAQVEPGDPALLESAEGDVRLANEPARAGAEIRPGTALATGEGRAVLRYADGTSLSLRPGSALRLEAAPGKRLILEAGAVEADVARQPAGLPLVVATPNAEARVLGTRLSIQLTAEGTRLEVREGRVRLVRKPDGASVDVAAGNFALAARGVALLTRPLPEEPRTFFLEVEELAGARGVRPADGMVRRLFLEPFDTAAGGWCVAAPGTGMEIAGDVRLARGTWHLWVRYRDEPGNAKIAFDVSVGGQSLGQTTTPGRGRDWHWKRFTFSSAGGPARIALRSSFEGVKAAPDQADFRQSPYGALNRWDRVCLTPDDGFTPE